MPGSEVHKLFIGGAWVDGAGLAENMNPSNVSDSVGVYAQAGREHVGQAVEAAHHASSAWGTSTPQERFDVLDGIGTEILARREDLGRLLAREEGKTLAEAIGEVVRAGSIFKFFAGEALRTGGERIPSVRPGVEVEIAREPLGVVGLITPWNFPAAIPAWKTAPALAFGNTVVLKPAELVPGSAWALAEIISRSRLPAGAFNLLMGKGSVLGEALIQDPRVAGVSFTGSQQVGARVAAACAARQARVQLEMGGKNPLVILDDTDLAVAVNAAVQGAFYSTGQRCTASSRLIVTDGIHDRFVTALIDRLKGLIVDDALASGTDIGPVVDEAQLAKDLGYIDIARGEGGKLVYGGTRVRRAHDGFYLAPALFTETENRMRINREEVFGPVATVVRVPGYEAALAAANDTEFGLCAGICTTSLKHASHFKKHVRAGMVMVNLPTAGVDYHVPFGGVKGSSYGTREQGRYAVEFYTTVKTTYIAP